MSVEMRTTMVRRASIRDVAMVAIAMPISHTPTTITVCSIGMRKTRFLTMLGSWPSGARCHSKTGLNRKNVTTTPTKTANAT